MYQRLIEKRINICNVSKWYYYREKNSIDLPHAHLNKLSRGNSFSIHNCTVYGPSRILRANLTELARPHDMEIIHIWFLSYNLKKLEELNTF